MAGIEGEIEKDLPNDRGRYPYGIGQFILPFQQHTEATGFGSNEALEIVDIATAQMALIAFGSICDERHADHVADALETAID